MSEASVESLRDGWRPRNPSGRCRPSLASSSTAVVFYLLQSYLADFGTWYLILLGALAIAVMLFAPQGIWGFLSQHFGIALFPVQRRLVRTDK